MADIGTFSEFIHRKDKQQDIVATLSDRIEKLNRQIDELKIRRDECESLLRIVKQGISQTLLEESRDRGLREKPARAQTRQRLLRRTDTGEVYPSVSAAEHDFSMGNGSIGRLLAKSEDGLSAVARGTVLEVVAECPIEAQGIAVIDRSTGLRYENETACATALDKKVNKVMVALLSKRPIGDAELAYEGGDVVTDEIVERLASDLRE